MVKAMAKTETQNLTCSEQGGHSRCALSTTFLGGTEQLKPGVGTGKSNPGTASAVTVFNSGFNYTEDAPSFQWSSTFDDTRTATTDTGDTGDTDLKQWSREELEFLSAPSNDGTYTRRGSIDLCPQGHKLDRPCIFYPTAWSYTNCEKCFARITPGKMFTNCPKCVMWTLCVNCGPQR